LRLVGVLGSVLILSSALGCGLGSRKVARMVGGHPIDDHYIDAVTYALYARGAYHEQRGQWDAARQAYLAASERDPDSAAIWTRLGAVECTARSGGEARAFALAERADAQFAPLWLERARCALNAGDTAAAISAAETSLRYEPTAEESSLILARALDRAGRTDAALRWLLGVTVARPGAVEAWRLLLEIARRRGRAAEQLRAEQALARLANPRPTRAKPRAAAPEAIDAALSAGNLEAARRLAIALELPADELAVRAAALGQPELAAAQAELVLSADPTNGNAWIAALVAADLQTDAERFGYALAAIERDALAPGPLATRLMADLIARLVGRDAAAAWLSAYGPLPAPSDGLERRVAARLESQP
jgi:tetratricopeptide (TPR) repeat protein